VHAREALDVMAHTDALNRHADALLVLAAIHRAQGRDDEALENIHGALRLYEQKGNLVSAGRSKAMLLEGALPA